MNENDQDKDLENDLNEPSDKDDEFSDEFNFDDADDHHEDALAPDEFAEYDDNEPVISQPEKKRNILIPALIGIVAVGFIGWKLVAWMMADPEPIEVVQEAPKPVPKPAPEMPIMPEAPKVTLEDKKDEVMANLGQGLADQNKVFNDKITQLESNFTATTGSLQQTQQALSAMQQQLNSLGNAVNQLSEQMKTMRQDQVDAMAKLEERRREVKPKVKAAPKPKVMSSTLVVHAIIPGRAWLRNNEGKTVTVAEGDSLGELGKVLKIDAPNGVVVTTSGVVLR